MNGHVTPGGGFQGGTIAGAVFIALTLVLSEQDVNRLIPHRPERVLQAAAPLTSCSSVLSASPSSTPT